MGLVATAGERGEDRAALGADLEGAEAGVSDLFEAVEEDHATGDGATAQEPAGGAAQMNLVRVKVFWRHRDPDL
jgi:hypothetical protein